MQIQRRTSEERSRLADEEVNILREDQRNLMELQNIWWIFHLYVY